MKSGKKTKKPVESTANLPSDVIAYRINNQFVQSIREITKEITPEKVYINSSAGQKIYQDFLIFILNMAVFRIYGVNKTVLVEHSIGDGVYCELQSDGRIWQVPATEIAKIKKEMALIIKEKIIIEMVIVTIDKAYEIMQRMNRPDVIKNLDFHNRRVIQLYKSNDYYDYYPRHLPFDTGCDVKYDIVGVSDGFILRFLNKENVSSKTKFVLPKLLFSQFQEHEKWIQILDVETVGDINRLIDKKSIRDFILTEEALHEKKIAHLADNILMRKSVKFVLIAGPSSSGKTTFAKRLAIQLRVNGYEPFVMGLDDYFLPRSMTPRLPNGDYDFENIQAMDLKLLNSDLTALLKGKEIRLPRFNFITGEREESKHRLQLGEKNILIIEGIHGLNDLLTSALPSSCKAKIYISALNQLNIDNHNRIPTTDCRKIRRIVRDSQFRGYSAEDTLSRWEAIADGEKINIFPFQEGADYMFNSSLTYELGVLRKHVMPLLRAIDYQSPMYNEAQDLIALFEHFIDIKDELVPNNSILREFISNSLFEY
jgi:uridine kinase